MLLGFPLRAYFQHTCKANRVNQAIQAMDTHQILALKTANASASCSQSSSRVISCCVRSETRHTRSSYCSSPLATFSPAFQRCTGPRRAGIGDTEPRRVFGSRRQRQRQIVRWGGAGRGGRLAPGVDSRAARHEDGTRTGRATSTQPVRRADAEVNRTADTTDSPLPRSGSSPYDTPCTRAHRVWASRGRPTVRAYCHCCCPRRRRGGPAAARRGHCDRTSCGAWRAGSRSTGSATPWACSVVVVVQVKGHGHAAPTPGSTVLVGVTRRVLPAQPLRTGNSSTRAIDAVYSILFILPSSSSSPTPDSISPHPHRQVRPPTAAILSCSHALTHSHYATFPGTTG